MFYKIDNRTNHIHIGFMLNDICNLNCEYCYIKNNMYQNKSKEDYKTLIKKIIEFAIFIQELEPNKKLNFVVEGGEPFFYLDIIDYFLLEVYKSVESMDLKLENIIFLTNFLLTENIKKIITKFPNILLEPSFHYKVFNKKEIGIFFKNCKLFSENILYVRILIELDTITLPIAIKILISILFKNKIEYNISPILSKDRIKLISNKGFNWKSTEMININNTYYDSNAIYSTKYPTYNMICENTGCYYFNIDGKIETHSCESIKFGKILNIFKDTFMDIYLNDKRAICSFNHCTECEFYDRYQQ